MNELVGCPELLKGNCGFFDCVHFAHFAQDDGLYGYACSVAATSATCAFEQLNWL